MKDGFVGGGDVINYTITVKNIGNVTLTGVTVSDTLTDGNTSTLNMSLVHLSRGLTRVKYRYASGWRDCYIYSYYIISDASGYAKISNSAVAIASSPGQSNNVSDTSDDGDDTDGNTVDDPTVTEINPTPGIEITKTVSK